MTIDTRTKMTESARREVARIDALSKKKLIIEVLNVMNGDTYPWRSIQTRTRQLDANSALYIDWSNL